MPGGAGGRISAGVGANLLGMHAADRNQEATVYVGNVDPQGSEELIWELFVQAGPVVNVYMPKDRITNLHQSYGFVEFKSEEDADYAIKILNMCKLFGKPIRVNKSAQDRNSQDVGANLFVGNLDPDVDEKLLYDTFGAFGVVVNAPKVMRDPETGLSKGFGFISFDCFEAADSAIEAMNGQFLMNRPISVTYAFKKDTRGERHGTPAERLLAAQGRSAAAQASRPHTLFATGPRQQPSGGFNVEGPQVAMGASGFAAGMPMPPPPAMAVPLGVPGMMAPPPMMMGGGHPGMGGGHPGMPPPPPWVHGGGHPGHPGMPPPPPWARGGMPPPPGFFGGPGMRPPPPYGGMPPQQQGGYHHGMPPPPSYGGMPPPPRPMAPLSMPPPPAAGMRPPQLQAPGGGLPPPPMMVAPPPPPPPLAGLAPPPPPMAGLPPPPPPPPAPAP